MVYQSSLDLLSFDDGLLVVLFEGALVVPFPARQLARLKIFPISLNKQARIRFCRSLSF